MISHNRLAIAPVPSWSAVKNLGQCLPGRSSKPPWGMKVLQHCKPLSSYQYNERILKKSSS